MIEVLMMRSEVVGNTNIRSQSQMGRVFVNHYHIRCIRVLATEILGEVSVTRTHGRGEEPLLRSGWTLIISELSSPDLNSLVRAERSFAIRYLNVVIKPLCGNLDICINY